MANFDLNEVIKKLPELVAQVIAESADEDGNTSIVDRTSQILKCIECFTPSVEYKFDSRIPLLNGATTSSSSRNGSKSTPILHCEANPHLGLSKIKFKDLNLDENVHKVNMTQAYFLWLQKNLLIDQTNMPGWNNFMDYLCRKLPGIFSNILCTPLISTPSSDFNAIYTTLMEAIKNSEKLDQKYSIVTFDLPLYLRARDIIEFYRDKDSRFKHCYVRLSSFHVIMSLMGEIGKIMENSGLKDVMLEMYSEELVEKIMSGHAYSRALRAHSLIHLVLAKMIFQEVILTAEETISLNKYCDPQYIVNIDNPQSAECVDPCVKSAIEKFQTKLQEFRARGPTAALWIQYFEMIIIIKLFIESERSRDWDLQIYTLKKMIPVFHASGHYHYAKAIHIFLQDSDILRDNLGNNYNYYIKYWYFTIRKSPNFSAGIWSDMTIEQWLMKSLKISEDFDGEKCGIQNLLLKFIIAMPFLIHVIEGLRVFSSDRYITSEPQGFIDARRFRINKDNVDLEKVGNWFADHPPFPINDRITCISTGQYGDGLVNCHRAFEIGTKAYEEFRGRKVSDAHFYKRHRVVTLGTLDSCLKLGGGKYMKLESPYDLFKRVLAIKKTEKDLLNLFSYELSTVPLPLFDVNGMREADKAVLYKVFTPFQVMPPFDDETMYIIDGEFLLHEVMWSFHDTYIYAALKYVLHVRRYYSKVIVVFDGYESRKKDPERLRRKTTTVPDIMIDENNKCLFNQQTFLSNNFNKKQFISLLKRVFDKNEIGVIQADADSDPVIVMTAIEKAELHDKVVIVGDNVNLLVLLTEFCSSINNLNKSIYFLRPEQMIDEKIVPKLLFDQNCLKYPHLKNFLCFVHAFSGCDTTSALYGQNKLKYFGLLDRKRPFLNQIMEFYNPNASRENLIKAGTDIVKNLYAPCLQETKDEEISLKKLRYLCYRKRTDKSSFNLAALPPTDESAEQHFYRTYYQVQLWMGNDLDPLQWGWKNTVNGLFPVETTKEPLPENFLKIVACQCKKACGPKCSCKKVGLLCSQVCAHCEGKNCSNVEEPRVLLFDDDNEEEGGGSSEARNEFNDVNNAKDGLDEDYVNNSGEEIDVTYEHIVNDEVIKTDSDDDVISLNSESDYENVNHEPYSENGDCEQNPCKKQRIF